MSPNKLKNGHGEEVCIVLMSLCQMALKNKFRFKKPVIRDEGAGLDDEADELNGDEMDGGADLADEIHADNSDDEIDEDMDLGGVAGIQADMAKQMEAEMAANAIIYSGITKEKWMIEVERVAHKLKVNKAGNDGKEWRSHLDQTKKYAEQVRGALPEVKVKLERLQDDATKALEKIGRKEAMLSRSFQGQTGDYRAHSENLKEIQESFANVSKNVEELENELSEVNNRLETTSKKIDDTGKTFSDNTPLQNMKKAITNVKTDIKSIDIRIGGVSNTLL
jgi:estrogen-related receptor beta like 1